jgi:hypothetical protein
MNTSIDDDLRGKKIEINNELHLSSSENLPQPKSNNSPGNLVKNAYSKLVNNIKFLTKKKKTLKIMKILKILFKNLQKQKM